MQLMVIHECKLEVLSEEQIEVILCNECYRKQVP